MRCRSKGFLACAALAPALLAAALAAGDRAAATIAPFSAAAPGDGLPAGWSRTAIKGVERPTRYRLVQDGERTVLQAEADASAAAVVHKLSVSPAEQPRVEWRWKVSPALSSGDPRTRDGDDYAARIYVMFDYPPDKLPLGERLRLELARALYDPEVPAAALCYVWDARLARGTITASPYTSRVRIVVADGATRLAGQWSAVERDVNADFRAAFGEEPPAISAVAVATDTDNTRNHLTAWYGDIVLKKRIVTAPARE